MNFISSAAWVNLIGVIALLSLLAAGVWYMTKNWLLSAGLEALILLGSIITYMVKSSVFEGLLAEVLGKLDLFSTFQSISSNNLLDVSGIILYLSLILLFHFLTMQMIQKRRWS